MRLDPRTRRTKIVATVGPACANEATLIRMVEAGVNVLRINSSHGTSEIRGQWIDLIHAVRKRLDRPVGILVDLQGPRIRVGVLAAPMTLEEGRPVVIAIEADAQPGEIPTTYAALAEDVEAGNRILLDDGLLQVDVSKTDRGRVHGVVRHGGQLASNKGMNLPGVKVSAPAVTEKDAEDVQLAIDHGADIIGMSFVRRAEDVAVLREMIPPRTQVLCKIEKDTALDDLPRIVDASDAIMVARGDLGVELPFEEVPLAQKRVIQHCNRFGCPVVTATQMLESMITNPRPTRAEASDVANAVLDGTDAVMLSAETAIGKDPVGAVRAMVRIVEAVERAGAQQSTGRRRRADRVSSGDVADAIAVATSVAAEMVDARLIVCLTSSGFTARKIAAARPSIPIIGLTPEPKTFQQLGISWGITPVLVAHVPTYDQMLAVARERLTQSGFAEHGDLVVVTAGVPFDLSGTTNLLKVEVV